MSEPPAERAQADPAAPHALRPAQSRNLELKVRCDLERLGQVQADLSARGVALTEMAQRDTYFTVGRGRLKLREISTTGGAATAELIAYDRMDASGARWSTYYRVPIAAADVRSLHDALASTVGTLVEVVKIREVGLLRHTRVHLDRVRGLGEFIELETVVGDDDSFDAAAELDAIAAELGLIGLETVAGSYSDELMKIAI